MTLFVCWYYMHNFKPYTIDSWNFIEKYQLWQDQETDLKNLKSSKADVSVDLLDNMFPHQSWFISTQ